MNSKSIKFLEIISLAKRGLTLRKISKELLIHKDTAHRYIREYIRNVSPNMSCPCGRPVLHKGWCRIRFRESPIRQEFIKNWLSVRPHIEKKPKIPIEKSLPFLRWPFLTNGRELPSYVKQIQEIVPTILPEQVRSDVCQEMALAILEGELTEEEIPLKTRDYIKKVYGKHSINGYKTISLYQPIRGFDNLTIMDTIASERFHF